MYKKARRRSKLLTGVLLRGFSSRTEPLSREKKRRKKIPVFLNKRRILATNNGLQYCTNGFGFDPKLLNEKKGVTQVYFISRLLGRQLEYSF